MPIDDITKTGRQTYRDLQNQNNESMSGASGNSGSLRLMLNKQLSPVEYVPFNELGDFGHSRYDRRENGVPSWALSNLEDWRGQNQSAAEQWVHGITKGVGLAATTFLDGTLGLLYGIGQGVAEGRASALWDNDLSNALQDFNQKMEEWLPNYRTQEEQERNWWQNAGTANFWADGFLKNLGFSVGAFYSGNAWLKGLKALGWVKNSASAQAVGSLLSGFNEGRIEANNAQRDFLTLQNQLISDARERRAMEIAANPYDSDEVKIQKLKTLDDNVKLQQDDALQRAHQMGMATLIGNTLILTADNMWQFGKLYSRGFTNAKGIMGRIEDGMMKQGIRGGIKEGGKYVAETVSKPRAVLRGFSNAASEGFEELNQAAIAEGAGYWRGVDSPDAYYEALKDPNAQLQTKRFFEALGTGLTNTYGNGDRWEEFAIGFLTGAIGMPTFGSVNNADANTWLGRGRRFGISGGIVGEYRSQMQQSRENEESARVMNAYLDKLATNANYFSQSQSFTNAMDGFAASNNKFEYENMSNNDDFAAISRFAKAGRLDDLKELVNQDFENMSDEQLADIAVNTTPNIIRKDDGTIAYEDINGNVAIGGWRDATGKLMSETPEGREQMREDLKAKRDKILYEIGEYEKSVEAVRAVSNNSLPDDQVNELAWLYWKGKMFNNRYRQIQKKQEENLTGMLNASQRYSDRASQDFETYTNMMNAVKSEIRNISNDINEIEDLIAGLNNDIDNDIANDDATPISEEHIGKLNEINSKIESIRRSKGMYAREKRRKTAQQQRLKESLENEIIQSKIALRNDYQDYVDSQKRRLSDLQDAYWNDMDKNASNEQEWEFGKYLQGIADEMTKFLSYIKSSDNPLQLASKIEANEKFISWAEDGVMKELLTSEMGITGEEYDRIMQDLKDTAMIAKTAKQFKERYDEFSKNPAKLVANRSKIDKAKEKVNNIIDKQKKKKEVNNTPTSDIVKSVLEGDINLDDLAQKVEGTSAESKLDDVKDILNVSKQLKQEISASEADDVIKDIAISIADAATLLGENAEEVQSAFNNLSIDPQFFREAGIEEGLIDSEMAKLQELTKDFDSLIPEVEGNPANNIPDEMPDIEVLEGETKETRDGSTTTPSIQDQKKAQDKAKEEYENTTAFISKRDGTKIANEAIGYDESLGHRVYTEKEKEEVKEDTIDLIKNILEWHKEGRSYTEVSDDVAKILNAADLLESEDKLIYDYIDNLYGKAQTEEVTSKDEQPVQVGVETHQTTDEESLTYNASVENNINSTEKAENKYYKPQQSLLPFSSQRVRYDFTPYYQIIETILKVNEKGLNTLSDNEKDIYNKYHAKFRYSPQYMRHIVAVGKYLDKVGAFSYVGNGNVQLNDTIGFTISKELQDDPDVQDTIVLMTKNGQIVGSLPSLKFDKYTIDSTPGLAAFINKAINQWNESGNITMQSKVNKYMIGQLPFTEERHTLNEVYGNEPFNIGISFNGGTESIKSNPGVTADTEPSPMELHTMLPLGASKGQPFLLFETKDKSLRRSYIPVPFLMPTLNQSTANSTLGNIIRSKIESLPNYNNNTVMPVINELNELLSVAGLHINYLDNGNIKIDVLRHGELKQEHVYNGPASGISSAFDTLLDFDIPFQISRRFMNTKYSDGQDYNRMIGELANINLGVGSTHTVSNWFTINPVGADGKMIEGVAPKTTRTNPNAHGGTSVNWNGQEYSCNIGHQKVYDNQGKEYNGVDKLEILSFAEAQQKEMTKPFVSRFCSQDQLFDPNTRKFIPKPTTTNDVVTSFNARLQVPREQRRTQIQVGQEVDNNTQAPIPQIVYTNDITTKEGTKGAAQYDRTANTIRIDNDFLKQKFDEKAWTKPRKLIETIDGKSVESQAEPLPEDTFTTYEDWEQFVVNHEYQHSLYSRKDFDKEFPDKTEGDYETEINRRALEQLRSTQNVSTSLDTMDDVLLDAEAEPYTESDSNFALAWTFLSTEQKGAFLKLDSPVRSTIQVELGKLVNKKITRDTPKSEYFFASQKRINQLVGLDTISSSSRPTTTSQIEDNSIESLLNDITNEGNEPQPTTTQETSQEDLRKKARDRGVIFRDARHQKVWEALTPEQQAKFANLSEYKGGQVWDRLLGSYDNSKGFDTNKLGGSVDDVLDKKVKFRVTDKQKVEPFNLEHEKAWLRRVLPQFSDEEHLKIIDGLTKMGTNTEVYGMFIDGIILLNGTTQTRGTTYHEAFHAVFDTLLTDEERENVYKAGRQKFHKVGIDLEEALAEDFRKYTQGIEYKDTESGLAKIWRKLTSWIKRLFGYNRVLNQLYADINNGLYADRIPKVTDAIRMFETEEGKRLSDFRKIREVISRKTSRNIDFATMNAEYHSIMKDANAVKSRIREAVYAILPDARVNIIVSDNDYYAHIDSIEVNGYQLLDEISRIESLEESRRNSERYNRSKTNEQRISEQALVEQGDTFDFDARYREIPNTLSETREKLSRVENALFNSSSRPREFIQERRILTEERDNLRYQMKQLLRGTEYKEWLSNFDNLSEQDQRAILNYGLTKETWEELNNEGRENALLCFGSF